MGCGNLVREISSQRGDVSTLIVLLPPRRGARQGPRRGLSPDHHGLAAMDRVCPSRIRSSWAVMRCSSAIRTRGARSEPKDRCAEGWPMARARDRPSHPSAASLRRRTCPSVSVATTGASRLSSRLSSSDSSVGGGFTASVLNSALAPFASADADRVLDMGDEDLARLPMQPVQAAASIASTTRAATPSGTTTSIFILGRKSTMYSAPR